MEAYYPTAAEPATTEYILAVLRDEHRLLSPHDPAADPHAVLTCDTTIADWREACDLLGWRQLGHALNRHWEIDCTDAEWRAVLEPPWRRTLEGVCALIARHSTRPRIRPARLLGAACLTGGAFLTVRSLLHDAGADADAITPSAPLAPFTGRYPEVFFGPIAQLAPGALPPVANRTPAYNAALWRILAAVIVLITGLCARLPPLAAGGGVLLGVAYVAHWFCACWVLPTRVQFGELQTFRDLARTLANQAAP